MSKIRILPEILSNKIAAGEVVERPAAVVKELVENAIDAGSSRIMVEIEKGGRTMIRVADNGAGMGRDDALLSIERYATSKLASEDELFAIRTLGFRGEALPSIAAVSRFSLITRPADAEAATAIDIEGGKLKQVSETGAPPGTMVTVRQLFFNTPARRKFLKTDATEIGHIADALAAIALVHPGIHFRLSHNDKPLKNWPATGDAAARIVDVLGADLKSALHAIDLDEGGIAVSGWIALPEHARKTSRGIHVYVNGRPVRDRTVQHALMGGYDQRLVKGQFPVAAVMIRVPFDQVDVNVHPAKSEVRFARAKSVHSAVRRAVAQTLYEVDRPWGAFRYGSHGENVGRARFKVAERARSPETEKRLWRPVGRDARQAPMPRGGERQPATSRPAEVEDENIAGGEPIAAGTGAFGDMRVIGQLANTYIVCEGFSGLVLVDQHAAHERILFEQLCRRKAGSGAASQKLLVPETVELDFREAAALGQILPRLAELGLDIEPFGGNAFVVRALPAQLVARDVRAIVKELAEQAAETGGAGRLESFVDACRMVAACHSAIRARQRLDERQMKALLDQLDDCDNPSHCPHGRPVWVRWELGELEKMFKRKI